MSKPQLKVGLEIHTQLQTVSKLFSLSSNSTSSLTTAPNTRTSFFDISLPGTQPKLNFECLFQAIKLSLALNCKISSKTSFDRKHYFYGDQPLGYQITQHFNPISKDGFIKLNKRYHSNLNENSKIRIQQLQLEQDTGRSLYKIANNGISNIDFNRSNIPLIEMVTHPDFNNIEQIRSFLKTYLKMVKDLKICTGELESGSVRVDVNVSVTGHERVEIKNLPTISAIINAIKFEEKRQIEKILNGKNLDNEVETRGWDGKKTYHLRSKETSVDYRYVPDMELPLIKLNTEDLTKNITKLMPLTIEEKLDNLMNNYDLNLRDAKILLNNDEMFDYFKNSWKLSNELSRKKIINWLVHDLIGSLTKSEIQFNSNVLAFEKFVELIDLVENKKLLSKSNGKLLLLHLVNNKNDQTKNIEDLAKEFNLINEINDNTDAENLNNEIISVVNKVVNENEKIVKEIIEKGKIKKVNFLIGQCMRLTNGKIQPKIFEEKINELLKL